MFHPLVVTVILNTNRRDDTIACLAALEKQTYPNHKIIVLDNASSDGSVQAIRESFPTVEIVALGTNQGYAGNNNVGIALALTQGADWVFILNEDTILAPDCLTRLIDVAGSDPHIGIVGPMVYHHDEPNIIQSAGGKMGRFWNAAHLAQNQPDAGHFNVARTVDWISGCAILVRRTVIEEVGALDERFFYYWEEVEWCLRTRKRGWRIVHVPQAKLWHKGVQRNYQPKPSVTYYSVRNRFLMLRKHRAGLSIWIVTWAQMLRTLVIWTVRPKWRGMYEHRKALWRGTADFLRHRWGQAPF